jgi:hypothetical protein
MGTKPLLLSLAALILGVGVLMNPPASHAFPEPAAASTAWRLDFTYAKPQAIAVKTADGGTRWFWYIAYKVVNNTGDERLFIPEFTIATDAGDITAAGKGVPGGVFDAIKDREGNRLLENPIRAVGRLLQGEDNAKESVAIWPAFDHDIDLATIFISGISGETQVIKNPATQEDVTVRKTLMITYALPGTGGRVQNQAVLPRGEKWIMR